MHVYTFFFRGVCMMSRNKKGVYQKGVGCMSHKGREPGSVTKSRYDCCMHTRHEG